MSIVVNQNVPVVAPRAATPAVVLQPGSVISARVLQILGNNQVRIAIGSQSIDVLSQVPLQAGQTLQLAVSQVTDGIRLAVVNAQGGASASASLGDLASSAASLDTVTLAPNATILAAAAQTNPAVAAPTNQLTPQEALAVSTAAQIAATQQTSLAPLFANLGVAAGLDSLPAPVQMAVAQLLAQRTGLDQNLTGADVKQAFQSSGLFLEANLASGSVPSAATPDLKAALIVLRQVLATSLNGATAAQNATAPSTPVAQGAAVALAVTVAQGATSQAVLVLQRATSPAPVAQDTGFVLMPVSTVPGQVAELSLSGSSQPVFVTITPEAPATASPALEPLLASEIGATGTSPGGAALPIPDQVVLDLSAAGQVVAPASAAGDAAALAAANTAVLSLLQETPQVGPQFGINPGLAFDDGLMLSLLPVVTGARAQRIDEAEFARSNVPPPPISGALPAAQPVVPATLVSNSPSETAMHHLIADAEGALARQTLLQVASLPDRVDGTVARQDPAGPRWNFEIPFVTPQGTSVAQFEISRDGGGNEVEAAKRVWRARFSLNVEPAGPIHALISLAGDKTSVRMWAERPATAAQLRAGASQLSQALVRAELKPGDIVIRDGTPPQPAPAPAGHFLDRAS
jgi:Flagellar hook-length control protein FliK